MTNIAYLNNDKPIENEEQDLLGYSYFAKQFATAIHRAPKEKGFVIGLQGQWGMGKTSVLNLMKKHYVDQLLHDFSDKAHERKYYESFIHDFQTWAYSSLDESTRSYLALLLQTIYQHVHTDLSEKITEKIKNIKSYEEIIGFFTGVALSTATGFAQTEATMSLGKSLISTVTNLLPKNDNNDNITTIKEKLKFLNQKIIIILDDLDRLQPEELNNLLILIKTVGNLPNVIHILVYDRIIADELLLKVLPKNPSLNTRTPTALEKIIQIELDMPMPLKRNIKNLFYNLLKDIIKNRKQDLEDNVTDWRRIEFIAFENYLLTPRDCIKFINAFSVTWPMVAEEAYLPEFIFIELLRIFDSKLYLLIKNNSHMLLNFNEQLYKVSNTSFNFFKTAIPETRREQIFNELCIIFPKLHEMDKKNINNKTDKTDITTIARAVYINNKIRTHGKRICDISGFDIYFMLNTNSDYISNVTLQAFCSPRATISSIENIIKQCLDTKNSNGTNLTASLFDEIIDLLMISSEVCNKNILTALINTYEIITLNTDHTNDFFDSTSKNRLEKIIRLHFEHLRATDIIICIENIIDNPRSMAVPAYLLYLLGSPYGLIGETKSSYRIDIPEDEIIDLINKYIYSLENNKKYNNLPIHTSLLWSFLTCWSKYGSHKKLATFISHRTRIDANECYALININIIKSNSSKNIQPTLRITQDLFLNDIIDYKDLALIATEHLKSTSCAYSDEEKYVINTFIKGI